MELFSISSSSMDAILNFQERYIKSVAIKNDEYNEYRPTSRSNLNIPGNINIHIENQDDFYLLVEGRWNPVRGCGCNSPSK